LNTLETRSMPTTPPSKVSAAAWPTRSFFASSSVTGNEIGAVQA